MTKNGFRHGSGAAICFLLMALSSSATAQSTCSQFGTVSINGGQYIYQQNEWNSTAQQCATVGGVGFTLTTADFNLPTNGPPATYPSVYRGCHWGNCTSSNPFPIQEDNIASASTSVSITQPSGYNNDAAYDIWFNQTSTTSGQPNGTEIMIWINHQGSPQPFGSEVATATIDGATWEVWTGRQSSWNIVSYVRQTPVTSVSNLNLLPFFSDAVSRGSLEPSWWLIDVEYGFEIWTGGQGLAVSNISNWKLTWTFANGQTVTQLWNGSAAQNGSNVTVTNLSYNGSIPAGGSYNGVGFNGTWNGSVNSVPANFAINGVACH